MADRGAGDLRDCHVGYTRRSDQHDDVGRSADVAVFRRGWALPVRAARTIAQDNCGVNVLKYSDGELKVKTLNASFLLP